MCLGIPGKVVDIWDEAGTRMSTVDFGGTTKTVCLAYLPDMEIGEYTIVHAGFAIARLDEASANETLKMFDDLGVLDAELAGRPGTDEEGSGMKYLDEFRDPVAARTLVEQIKRRSTRTWTIMEVCGGQTHSIIRNGIDQLLGDAVEFIHGPGCPVCVTPLEMIDRALEIAASRRRDLLFVRRHAPGARQPRGPVQRAGPRR